MGRPAKFELEEILGRATHLFWERGTDAVSTRDLEVALDLRAPAIYRRFPSKHALLARCVDHYVDTVIVGRVRKLQAADDPVRGLQDYFLSTLEPHGREPHVRGCLLANTATQADGQVPEVHAAIHRGWQLVDAAFQAQIGRAQRAGQVDPTLATQAVSQSLLMSLLGLLTLARAGITDLRAGIDTTFSLLRTPPPRDDGGDS